MTTDTDLRTSIGITGRIDTVPAADLALHAQAVLREAVINTARHAHATELTVTITVGADLLIDVTDNGTGIPGDRRPRRTGQPPPAPQRPAAAAPSISPAAGAPDWSRRGHPADLGRPLH